MKNLKRILSLALASTMLIGMMVVGASATTVTDLDEVEHQTAAQTLLALGIMTGAEQLDGSLAFAPDGKLDRQAMAVMMARLINKGTDPKFADTDKPSFVDVKAGGWNVPYIEYCANFCVINGYGNGYFGPADELTSTQAARMMLNAMGYTWDGTGSWELATEVQARDLGLYDGLDDEITGEAMTRDDAAQMLYNALTAEMAGDKTYTTTGFETTTTLMSMWQINLLDTNVPTSFNTGMDGDDWDALEGTNWETRAAADEAAKTVSSQASRTASPNYELNNVLIPIPVRKPVQVQAPETLAHKYLSLDQQPIAMVDSVVDYYGIGYLVNGEYLVEEDVSYLMGHKAMALVKLDKNGDVDFTYGITDAASSVLYDGTVGGYSIPAAGNGYSANDLIRATEVVEFNNIAGTHSTVANLKGNSNAGIAALPIEWKLTVVNNGNGNFAAVVTPVELGRIGSITTTRYTLTERSALLGNVASRLIDDEILGYEGIAVGDYVTVMSAANTVSGYYELAKVNDIVTGTVDAIRYNDKRIQIDGTWYTQATNSLTTATSGFVDAVAQDVLLLGQEVTIVNVNGYFAYAEAEKTFSKDLIILTNVANTVNTSTLHNSVEASALFVADGTTATIKIDTLGNAAVADRTNMPVVDTLYNYTVSSDGYYTVVNANTTLTGYNTTVAAAKELDNNKIDNYLIADDAVLVVKYTTGNPAKVKYGLFDGKTVKGWKYDETGTDAIVTLGTVAGFVDNVRNVPYVQVAILACGTDVLGNTGVNDLPTAQGKTGNYGYVTSTPYRYADTSTTEKITYYVYTLWNGEEEITVYDRNTGIARPGRGDMVTYEDLGNGKIVSTKLNLTASAVKGYAASDEVLYLVQTGTEAGQPYEIADDVIVFYINNKTKKGADSGIISNAEIVQNPTTGAVIGYKHNVKIAVGTGAKDHTITILVIDVYNDLGTKTND